MASLLKRGDHWVAVYVDHAGKRRWKTTRSPDRRTAERIAHKLEADAALRREGVIDPSLDRYASSDRIPLSSHVADYVKHLELRGRSAKHVRAIRNFLERLNEHLGASRLSQLTHDAVERYLCREKAANRSARTLNWRQVLISGFVGWAVKTGRVASNPLRALQRQNETRDARRKRRALTGEELERLFAVAEKHGRRPFYAAAYYAGLRRGELERLTWGDVDLAAATVTISDGKARRRIDVLPLAVPLGEALRSIRPERPLPTVRVFPSPPDNATRKADFEEAGIELEDAQKRHADLHSLRSTLATDLARRGVSVQVAQRLLRHATVDLTLRSYTKLRVDDLAGGLAAILETSRVERAADRATGTEGANTSANSQGTSGRKRAQLAATTIGSDGEASSSRNSVAPRELHNSAQRRATPRLGGPAGARTRAPPIMSRPL